MSKWRKRDEWSNEAKGEIKNEAQHQAARRVTNQLRLLAGADESRWNKGADMHYVSKRLHLHVNSSEKGYSIGIQNIISKKQKSEKRDNAKERATIR